MNNDKKIKSLITIIIFLLITNIAMLIFFVVESKPQRKERNHQSSGMYKSLQNEVGFSKDQLTQYKALREEQMKKVHPMFEEVREARKHLYGLINFGQISDSLINADADSIAQKQKRLDLQMFGYFKNMRSICTDAQKQKFDSLMKEVVVRMIGRPGQSHKK